MNIVFNWVNATTRKDGTALAPADIASSVISLIAADGSATEVGTVAGNVTSASIPAPTAAGSYTYSVCNVDTHGDIGDSVTSPAPVVIMAVPSAPTNFTAVLSA